MALPKREILGILSDNLAKRGCVMPISRRRATRWAEGLNIPRRGERIIYTGLMYQIMPSIAALENIMSRIENSVMTKTMWMGRLINKVINVSAFMAWPSNTLQEAFDGRLRNIALLLRKNGIDFGYLYEEELYSGALIYDMGVHDVFVRHIEKIGALFRKHGIKEIITVDPHTTEILKEVLPKYGEDFTASVKSYVEVLVDAGFRGTQKGPGVVALHDSCIYARGLKIVEQPRSLLAQAGISVTALEQSGRHTQCCGGPIESLFPAKAKEAALERVSQLADGDAPIATMCPICYLNLNNALEGKKEIKDFSEYLIAAAE